MIRTNVRDATEPIPVVGGVTKGIGNAPLAQQIGGQEEEKGYLSKAYEYAGGAARTVYDSAGNAVLSHQPTSFAKTDVKPDWFGP